jgi:quinoprotein relay system zinc metallohydrolase 2
MKYSWCAAKAHSTDVARRRLLRAGVMTGAVLVARAAVGRSAAASTTRVAPGLHVRRGVDEDASGTNDNAIANAAFIVGRDAVAVVDPGGSLIDGQRLRARIREVTPLPIRHVVMSHVHPDHIFGAGAFLLDKPEFVGHVRLPNAMAQRGEYHRLALEKILGVGAAGPLVMPTRVIAEHGRIDLGDRELLLTAHGVAHSDCDLSVFDAASGTLLPGDLLFVERVPSLDGAIKGWQMELSVLKSVAAAHAIPGHGPASVNWPAAATDLERYLDVVLRETRVAVKRGLEISDAVAIVGQSERGKWKLFDDYHGHNVTRAFKEVEWES